MADQESVECRPSPAEDEIDLADLVSVLYRRRRLVVGGALLITLMIVGFAFLQSFLAPSGPPQWRAKAILDVGGYVGEKGEFHFIEEPSVLASRLQTRYEEISREEGAPAASGSLSAEAETVEKNYTGLVKVHWKGPKDPEALNNLNGLAKSTVDRHGQSLNARRNRLENRVDTLRRQVAGIEKRLTALKDGLAGADSGASLSPPAARTLLDYLSSREDQLQSELAGLRDRLAGIKQSTVLVGPAWDGSAGSGGGTRLPLIAFVAVVLGLFISTLAAFLAEFWSNNRDRIKAGD